MSPRTGSELEAENAELHRARKYLKSKIIQRNECRRTVVDFGSYQPIDS